MTDHPQQSKKNKRDAAWNLFSLGILVIWFIPEISTMFREGVFITRLSPALPGGVPVDTLEPANIALYLTAMVVKFLALALVICSIVMVVRPLGRGEVFTLANARWLQTATCSVGVWAIARFGIEGLGNNFAAATLGIDSWWGASASTPLSDAAPAMLLAMVLGLATNVIRRGVVLRDEVDGLV